MTFDVVSHGFPRLSPVQFDARDGPVAPPPYETLGPPSHLHFHNPRFGLEEGEEEDEEDLPPPYSPTMRPGGNGRELGGRERKYIYIYN